MEFKSESNRPIPHQYAQNGFKKTIDIYEDLINKHNGKLETKQTDSEDFYEKIQSYKDSQLLESIIKRYEIDIDKKQVKEIQSDIVDMTQLPQSLTEAYSMLKQIENDFDSRPAVIKKAFNNNIGEYIAGIQNGELEKVLQKYSGETIQNQVKEEPRQAQTLTEDAIKQLVAETIKNNVSNGGNDNV